MGSQSHETEIGPNASTGPAWQAAASFAALRHRHQLRKDGVTPYVAHPFRVAMTIRDIFGCDDRVLLTAALLHDTIEDTATDYDDLSSRFGVAVADVVAAMTKNMALPEKTREIAYDEQLARADWRARLIKLADCYDNLADLLDRSPHGLAKMFEKCDRAVSLASVDVADESSPARDPATRAVKALRELMDQSRSR